MRRRAVVRRSVASLRRHHRDGRQFHAPYGGSCVGRSWSGGFPLCALVVCDCHPSCLRAGLSCTGVAVASLRRTAPPFPAPPDSLSLSCACPTVLLVVGPLPNLDMT